MRRRFRVGLVLLTLVLALLAGPPPRLAAAAPSTEATTAEVTTRSGEFRAVDSLPDATAKVAPAADSVVALAQVDLTGPAGVVGVTWPVGAATPLVLYRTWLGGEASAWQEVAVQDAEGEEDARADGSEPIIVAGVDSVQVATVSPASLAAELSVFESSSPDDEAVAEGGATASTRTGRSASSAVDSLKPAIRSRSEWGADESIVGLPYEYGIVSGVMIHHTAGTNNYAAADVPGLLRSIQAYHVNGRGWKDIGYNVLIDRFGTVWEGRGGGLDKAVEGGHAYGETNARVFGLSFLGNFDTAAAPEAMIARAVSVIAWKFALHGVDPYGSTWGSGGQDGGSTRLEAISGHRDENATACPGGNVYALLGKIRSRVKDALATVDYTVTQPQATPVDAPLGPDPVDGSITLTVSGILDTHTVTELQRWLGVEADGVWGKGTTSALQARLGVSVTGVRNAATLRALQALVGASQTGVLDSATVSALQTYLNNRAGAYQPLQGTVAYNAHVSTLGWQKGVVDGAVSGTVGRSLQLEALRIVLPAGVDSGDIEYRGHVQDVGWQPWVGSDTYIGTVGRSLRLEAFQIRLTGALATTHTIRYRAHVQNVGWQDWVSDGATAGTVGRALRVEAYAVEIVPRETPEATVSYSAHVQGFGWLAAVAHGGVAGTTGRALRLEALRLAVSAAGVGGGFEWRAHVEGVGWQAWTSAGQVGTVGAAKRLEAVEIRLTGEMASLYTIRYRAHVQNVGWQPWVADGATAGTTGRSLRVEAVQIEVEPRDG